MSCLPLDMTDALDTFNHPDGIQAYERTGSRAVNGVEQSVASATRIMGLTIVLAADPQKLKLLTGGDVSSGGLILHTADTLYFRTPDESRQSFVVFQGLTFRVVGTDYTRAVANLNTYYAVRYIDNGSDSSIHP